MLWQKETIFLHRSTAWFKWDLTAGSMGSIWFHEALPMCRACQTCWWASSKPSSEIRMEDWRWLKHRQLKGVNTYEFTSKIPHDNQIDILGFCLGLDSGMYVHPKSGTLQDSPPKPGHFLRIHHMHDTHYTSIHPSTHPPTHPSIFYLSIIYLSIHYLI